VPSAFMLHNVQVGKRSTNNAPMKESSCMMAVCVCWHKPRREGNVRLAEERRSFLNEAQKKRGRVDSQSSTSIQPTGGYPTPRSQFIAAKEP